MLNMIAKMSTKSKMEVFIYEGNLNVDELMDWIDAMDKYFDYEEVNEANKVNFFVIRMKGNQTLWWDEVQVKRKRKGKSKIRISDRMVVKIKNKFMPKDYQLNIFKQLQNLRQKSTI